jgi:hypothetical protein
MSTDFNKTGNLVILLELVKPFQFFLKIGQIGGT